MSESAIPSTSDLPEATAEAGPGLEGCPTPLAWHEVVSAVRESSIAHSIEHRSLTLTATVFGEGTPLLLLPGFLGDHELYALTSYLLRDEYCCVMVDPPALPSEKSHSSAGQLGEWSQVLRCLLDKLNHDSVHVHGSSLGGLIALKMMQDHPDRIRSASLQCAFTRWPMSLTERCVVAAGRRSRRTLGDIRSAMRIQQANHRRWFPPFDPTRWDFFSRNIAATRLADAAHRAQVARRVDLRDGLANLTQPVLIIQSEGDGQTASAAQCELHMRLPQSTVEILDNCGRVPHLTHPHRLVKLIRAFREVQ